MTDKAVYGYCRYGYTKYGVVNVTFDEAIEQLEKHNISVNVWYSPYFWKHAFIWYKADMCIKFDEGLTNLEK